MSQDTRRDKRAKILSLNVRYKSATVDEFIDNHSHDVSKGGLFIKTQSPFQPGTLLKFEIRIASEKPVISGVGRVVWKREPPQTSPERPPGMGVKFIKIDENSRLLIERLVATRADAGSAFASENGVDEEHEAPRPAVASAPPAVPRPGANSATTPPPAGYTPKVEAGLNPKRTMVGMGSASPSSPPPPIVTMPEPARTTSPMFPAVSSVPEPSPKDRTVMKQAAELLEEALKEAGGSMDEIGNNPLFSGSTPPPVEKEKKAPEPPPKVAPPAAASRAEPGTGAGAALGDRRPAPPPLAVATQPLGAFADLDLGDVHDSVTVVRHFSPPEELRREALAASAMAKVVPSTPPSSSRPRGDEAAPPKRESTSARAASTSQGPSSSVHVQSDRAPARSQSAPPGRLQDMLAADKSARGKKKRSAAPFAWIILLTAGVGGAFVYKDRWLGAEAAAPPAPVASAPVGLTNEPPPPPLPSATPPTMAAAAMVQDASAAQVVPSLTTGAILTIDAGATATHVEGAVIGGAPDAAPDAKSGSKPAATPAPQVRARPRPRPAAPQPENTSGETPAEPTPPKEPPKEPATEDTDNPY